MNTVNKKGRFCRHNDPLNMYYIYNFSACQEYLELLIASTWEASHIMFHSLVNICRKNMKRCSLAVRKKKEKKVHYIFLILCNSIPRSYLNYEEALIL